MELSLATRTVADHTVLEVGGEIDVYTAPALRERLIELVDGGRPAGRRRPGRVEFLDSTGLGVLVGAHRAAARGRRDVRPGLRPGARCSRSSGSPAWTRSSTIHRSVEDATAAAPTGA